MKTLGEINERIRRGEAIVMTAGEFKEKAEGLSPREVDVVTCATCALMSGTAALLSMPVARRGEFQRARRVWINGIPALPGPCPNERLGLVEAVVFGSSPSSQDPRYGGGHLFRDLVEGRGVEVVVEAAGRRMEKEMHLEEMEYAKLFTTRSSFRNYFAFVNRRRGRVKSIFSVLGLRGPLLEASVSGCGEINPLQNDPGLLTIGVGTRILLNGAPGYVLGRGTRFSRERPNLSVTAEMRGMIPRFMGGFLTSAGPECITSLAVPIPVLNREIFEGLKVLDPQIGLPIADVHDRLPFASSDYGRVWREADTRIRYLPERCQKHRLCPVEERCPTGAFRRGRGIDKERCFECGVCVGLCPSSFRGRLGTLPLGDREVPITLRQSCRRKAEELAGRLKNEILRGRFLLSEPLEPLGGGK